MTAERVDSSLHRSASVTLAAAKREVRAAPKIIERIKAARGTHRRSVEVET